MIKIIMEIISNNGQAVREGMFFYRFNVTEYERNLENSMYYNLLNAAKFVVQMFYKTGSIYKCTSAKVEKILAISQLVAYKENIDLFEEKIIIKTCGIGYNEVGAFFYSDIIDGEEDAEDTNFVNKEMDNSCEIPSIYDVNMEQMPKELQTILEYTFRTFASYKSVEIGKEINDFKNDLSIGSAVDKNRTIKFFENKIESLDGNTVYKYILETTYSST